MATNTISAEEAQAFAAEMLQAMNDTEERVKHSREDRIATALERIADALEARNAIDGQMAAFAELLQQGAPQVSHDGMDTDLAPDGLPRKRR